MATTIRHIINFRGQRETNEKTSIRVLDLEPAKVTSATWLTAATVCGWIGNALEEVGWLEFLPGMGLLVIDWEKHNGNSTKKRALLALRKTRERMRTGA